MDRRGGHSQREGRLQPLIARRGFLQLAAAAPLAGAHGGDPVFRYIESLARADGGYAWDDEPESVLTTTFAAIGCYQVLGREPPRKAELGRFVRAFASQATKRKERPLRRFEFERVQALLWLGEKVDDFRDEAANWKKPSDYTQRYERRGNPVFQQEVGALRARQLLAVTSGELAWIDYVTARRRSNGSFNNTPAKDGGDGHVMNTWWGLQAMEALGLPRNPQPATVRWLQSCQRPSGAFTWAPKPELAPDEDLAYTWAAVSALAALDAAPRNRRGAISYLHLLRNPDGGYGDRPGLPSNVVATHRALEALKVLQQSAMPARQRAPRVETPPASLKAFTVQIEAAGHGSPADAVELARTLRIHLWGAKNGPAGWTARAQALADERKVPVSFFMADEEYGTDVHVPGLGTYSHLVDVFAPPNVDSGRSMAKDPQPIAWPKFRDQRIAALKRAGGGIFWQFNENEELTRVLLDEAVARGTYDAISSFHFGNENFLHSQPFLNAYRHRLPMIGLQDAHGPEAWWNADFLTGFRTVFLGAEPTLKAFVEALRRRWVVSIRQDDTTGGQRRLAGGSNEVRAAVLAREAEWGWQGRRPLASVVAVTNEAPFEVAQPATGVTVRVRTAWSHTNQGALRQELAALVRLVVDGREVPTVRKETKAKDAVMDVWHEHEIPKPAPGKHRADATVRDLQSKATTVVTTEWTS